jgi:hypothetical protein
MNASYKNGIVIDSHVHIGENEYTTVFFTFDTFLNFMNKHEIDFAVAMPNPSKIKSHRDSNTYMMKEYRNFQDSSRFFPFLLIDPFDLHTLDQIKEEDVIGAKFHPSIMETPINNDKLIPFMEYLEESGKPIIVHCGRNSLSDISHIIEVANRYEKVNFIAAHMGGNATDLIEKTISILKNACPPNLYLDTSAGKLPRLIQRAGESIGYDKIIFGSDEPYADFRIEKKCVDLTEASEDDKKMIFSENILGIIKRDK